MAALIKSGYRGYRYIVHELADPRVTDWFLVGSPFYPLGLITLYLYLVKTAGPRYMKDRPAYKLSGIIALYNFTQIVLNAALFIKAIGHLTREPLFCRAVDYSDSPRGMYEAEGAWQYFMLKVLDLMDTIFFVLRKKNKQVTFLHLYHHLGMMVLSWLGTRYLAGGHAISLGIVNTFVHVFMYVYYFVTNMWPEYKANLWWKKHITQLQMTQFGVLWLLFVIPMIFSGCPVPMFVTSMLLIQNTVMILMFYDFYRKAYGKKKNN